MFESLIPQDKKKMKIHDDEKFTIKPNIKLLSSMFLSIHCKIIRVYSSLSKQTWAELGPVTPFWSDKWSFIFQKSNLQQRNGPDLTSTATS